jgi:hypothetical protein
MSYYFINYLNNTSYPIYLCSKIKVNGIINLYHKYLLTEDIKEHLSFKLSNSNKESIKYQIYL